MMMRVFSSLICCSLSSPALDCDPLPPSIERTSLLQLGDRSSGLGAAVDNGTDWSTGRASWLHARSSLGGAGLWARPNRCEKDALAGSAPLTTLFGISEFWHEIQERRKALGKSDEEELEVHVLGAAYPFEGRADWSLLARQRPASMKGVRVVLVLGTPWQADNVPSMQSAKEWDAKLSLLQIDASGESAASAGGLGRCSTAPDGDASFSKAELCRKHGLGLEVVCVEQYYQDAVDELARPDLVVMFSPGFPQLGRRSWDTVLRRILAEEVPIMVADLLYLKSETSLSSSEVGTDWDVKLTNLPVGNSGEMLHAVDGEDSMTLLAMLAYGAHRLAARTNPFPILIDEGRGKPIIHKNGVLQVFRGWTPTEASKDMPSAVELAHNAEVVRAANLDQMSESGKEFVDSLLTPTSRAYDESMWQFYKDGLREFVERYEAAKPEHVDAAYKGKLAKLGLFGITHRETPWSIEDWIFILKDLDVGRPMMEEYF